MHGIHRATRQEYAIKVLDKGHLKRNNKLGTALAEKNTLVRLGSGHPGIVRLHWAFQDNWSLCELLLSLVVSFVQGRSLRRLPSGDSGGGSGASLLAKGDPAECIVDRFCNDATTFGITSGGDLPMPSPLLRQAVRLP